MPSLRLSEIEDLMKDEDELSEVELRRKKKKEEKTKPLPKYQRPNIYDNGGDKYSTDSDE